MATLGDVGGELCAREAALQAKLEDEDAAALKAKLEAKLEQLEIREARLNTRERRIQEHEAALSLLVHDEDAEKTRDAIKALKDALLLQDEDAGLAQALREIAEPGPKASADALKAMAAVQPCGVTEQDLKVKAAAAAIRDVIVSRCSSPTQPGDRPAFLRTAEKAWGRSLISDPVLRSSLLMAYHKMIKKLEKDNPALVATCLSNAELKTKRRGHSRGKRTRNGWKAPPVYIPLGELETVRRSPSPEITRSAASSTDAPRRVSIVQEEGGGGGELEEVVNLFHHYW